MKFQCNYNLVFSYVNSFTWEINPFYECNRLSASQSGNQFSLGFWIVILVGNAGTCNNVPCQKGFESATDPWHGCWHMVRPTLGLCYAVQEWVNEHKWKRNHIKNVWWNYSVTWKNSTYLLLLFHPLLGFFSKLWMSLR